MAKVLIIGAGNVGGELRVQLRSHGHEVVAQVARSSLMTGGAGHVSVVPAFGSASDMLNAVAPYAGSAEAVMLAIPNANKGADELAYMQAFAKDGKHLVTSAKAAHAFRCKDVLALGQPVGRRATVGGGTDMLEVLRRRKLRPENVIVDAIVNGTLNSIWSRIQQGGSIAAAVREAQRLGYAEPGSDDMIGIINGELEDVVMKAAIIYNVALREASEETSTPDDFRVVTITHDDLMHLTGRNARYRFILRFSSIPHANEFGGFAPGSIEAQAGRWTIKGGFVDVGSETPWFDWLRQVDGVNNGFNIYDPYGEDTGYALTGPGAGPVVTAKAMVRDLHDLLWPV